MKSIKATLLTVGTFLFLAAIITLFLPGFAGAGTSADWKGTWHFNYGGADNQTVYITTTCNSTAPGATCSAYAVFNSWATGFRASDGQNIMLGIFEAGAPTTWSYYETLTPSAMTPYDRIVASSFTGTYFDNITGPYQAACGVCPCASCPSPLGSGLTFGRRISTNTPQPGTCKDWLGQWSFTYYNVATTDNLTDTITDNVTITSVCDDNASCMDNTTWNCIAKGTRKSDSSPIMLFKAVGIDYYSYGLLASIDDWDLFGSYGVINDSDFFLTFFWADLSSADTTIEPTNLIGGKKIITAFKAPAPVPDTGQTSAMIMQLKSPARHRDRISTGRMPATLSIRPNTQSLPQAMFL